MFSLFNHKKYIPTTLLHIIFVLRSIMLFKISVILKFLCECEWNHIKLCVAVWQHIYIVHMLLTSFLLVNMRHSVQALLYCLLSYLIASSILYFVHCIINPFKYLKNFHYSCYSHQKIHTSQKYQLC